MKTQKEFKWFDDAHRVCDKLEKLAVKAYVLATLIYALLKILAHH
jgi:hypothetical protein